MDEQEHLARALAAAAYLDLAIDATLLPGVSVHFERLRRHALTLLDMPLDDRCEPAPVFRP